MIKYFTKLDEWFKAGSEAFLEEFLFEDEVGIRHGIFRGTYVVGSCNPLGYDIYWYKKGYKDGDEVEMTEVCSYGEFIETEINDN